ncbi:MAG: hypothetical protein K0R38_5823, partial [Polyangiaceae bacterium]|nr:hypothetical protein [Polyangiaceae bacterium]
MDDALKVLRRDLLRQRLSKEGARPSRADATIPRAAREGGSVRMSYAQQRLWFVEQLGVEEDAGY